ncbi:hypothetical protein FRC04_006600 [Tulasnella sp. 424]|nr:hypothetical protein FRC04_006600 [Tulasnella sp. 424]KAG8960940.1 hypothetical protein FRC05_006432 [Tulasnella sp. 425]
MSAKPLNVTANGKPSSSSATSSKAPEKTASKAPLVKPEEISSPHELTAFVESLLTQLETKFDDMSTEVLDKMTSMSTRVNALEVAIQDLINDTYVPGTVPATPAPGARSDSGRFDSAKSDTSEH